MAHEALTCAEGITPERLSALRDETLTPAEAQWLRAHIAGCDACRARLADYDTLATALRQQRELEPGERVISGVRARLSAGASSRRRVSRRVWAGLATLAPVAAIILLFVYVFGGLTGRSRPATDLTPTVAATATATAFGGKPIFPTPTPALVTLPPMTPGVSAAAAWGTFSPVATYKTPNIANTQFILSALSPDGTTLAGTEMTNVSPGGGLPTVYLISFDLASHTYRRLGPHWTGYVGPWGGANAIDSRYLVYGYNTQPGATCGVCHNTLWSYDRQTGATWQFDPGKNYSGDLDIWVSGDHVAFWSVEMQVWVADLASQQVKLVLPIGAQPATNTSTPSTPPPDDHVVGFNWPYLVYTNTPASQNGSQPQTTLDILNLQSGVNTTANSLDTLPGTPSASSSSGIQAALITGDTLYLETSSGVNGVDSSGAPVNTTYMTLYSVRHIFASAVQPQMLARWVSAQNGIAMTFQANGRLITLDSGYIWDIAEQRLVQINPPGANAPVVTSLSGGYLLVATGANAANGASTAPAQGDIYDTSALPVR